MIQGRQGATAQLQECTSTTVSRSAEGLLMPSAVLKWSLDTAMELRISASISSSSRSITSIFSRMHCSAASVHSAARSAPTYLMQNRASSANAGKHGTAAGRASFCV